MVGRFFTDEDVLRVSFFLAVVDNCKTCRRVYVWGFGKSTNHKLIFLKSLIKKANQSPLVNSLPSHFIYPFIPAIYPVYVVQDANIVNQPPRRRPLSLNPTFSIFYRFCVIFFSSSWFLCIGWSPFSLFRMFSSVWLLLLPLVLASRRGDHMDIVANTRLRLRFFSTLCSVTKKAWFPKAIGDPRKRTKVPFDESTPATDSQ